jgi:hypothetical protein
VKTLPSFGKQQAVRVPSTPVLPADRYQPPSDVPVPFCTYVCTCISPTCVSSIKVQRAVRDRPLDRHGANIGTSDPSAVRGSRSGDSARFWGGSDVMYTVSLRDCVCNQMGAKNEGMNPYSTIAACVTLRTAKFDVSKHHE